MVDIPKFKILEIDDIPKSNAGHKSIYTEVVQKIIEQIPLGKAMEIWDTPTLTKKGIFTKGIYNHISQQRRHKKLTNIKATRKTITDPTTKPPTKELRLYIKKPIPPQE